MNLKKAGCILLSKDLDCVALVYRKKHNDYSFPKGHIEGEESLSECALRETEEETGRMCHLLRNEVIGVNSYKNCNEGTIDTYMYLALDDGESKKVFREEDKEELVWVKISEVENKLTYPNLKEFWLKIIQNIDFKATNNRLKKEDLIRIMEELKIDFEEFWVLSSGALVMRNIFQDAGDLDIAVTEKGLQQLKNNFTLHQKENGWYKINDLVECVVDIKTPEKIEKFGKYNLQDINNYLSYLEKSSREKDIARISLVKEYIRKNMKGGIKR